MFPREDSRLNSKTYVSIPLWRAFCFRVTSKDNIRLLVEALSARKREFSTRVYLYLNFMPDPSKIFLKEIYLRIRKSINFQVKSSGF